ncbi:helix-turn-helix transcriptional regulator [Frankia sp. AgB1.9]|uniref:helix-turn-helix domain-containing protein n=1 Tax=unclassified Frankia TaxID=2632575 RepID=UPI0019325692|nr:MULTISPECIES: helix-turn-helix transcriptional regulator [unclassified Frankia]MBL7494148.1 helix-turn-helix transcriptional regulator [Frankia sp. AgW1.1]MBL7548895.1 helix-turn-helix transcriptional regulator [Frankia sp. AgB1.9]MBL7625200.1 helix-turn-helix transcriptional regulator [Frankia sp. AgB1.8]
MSDMELGDRIKQIRHRRGMTQDELAERSGVHLDTIKKLETKIRTGARISTLHALARALDVRTSDLLGNGVELDPDDNGDSASLLAMRRVLVPAYPAPSVTPMSGTELRQAVIDCVRLYSRSKISPLLAILPDLLARGDGSEGDKSDLATLYILAGQVLTHVRHEDLAGEAIRRAVGITEANGDRVLYSSAIDSLAWIFVRQARFDDVESMSLRLADDIEPRFGRSNPDELAAWGRALVRASTGAARNNKPQRADEHLALARLASERMGNDLQRHGVYWMSFGPHRLATATVENAVMLGDHERALALARDGVPVIQGEQYLRHLLNVSEAQIATGEYAGALDTIRGVHGTSSEWLVQQRSARRQVHDLLDVVSTRRARASGLAALAAEMHIRP